jgi:hypothetical protein
MRKADWKKKIIAQTQGVGTYRKEFLPAIDTLAGILEQRDKTHAEFTKSGGKSVIEYTNKNGSTNQIKNPLLQTWNDLNTSALAYWRDLGLTPQGLRKIDEDLLKPQKKKSALAEALKDLGG